MDVSLLAFGGTFTSPADGLAVGADWERWLQEGLVDTMPGQATSAEAVAATERVGRALIDAGADRLAFWWFDTVDALDVWPAIGSLRAALGAGD